MASAFDRPVNRLLVGQNPWPVAKQATALGMEVMECDFAPEDRLFVIDLDAVVELQKPELPMEERASLSRRFGRIDNV